MKKNLTAFLLTTSVTLLICFSGKNACDGWSRSKSPSGFEIVSDKLGFSGIKELELTVSPQEQQEALLTVFYLSGYFKPQNLWNCIVHMEFPNPEVVFKSIMQAVRKSGADQDNPTKFNATVLCNNLFNNETTSEADIADFLLYLGQSAFGREANQERYQLATKNWDKSYETLYMNAVGKLGLTDRIPPKFKDYDKALITGASRPGILARFVDFNYNLSSYKLKIKYNIVLLAGQRPLWAEIDGIGPEYLSTLERAIENNTDINQLSIPVVNQQNSIEEGKRYMQKLALDNNILLAESQPFIVYAASDTRPTGFIPDRTYPNYVNPGQGILTETLMGIDLYNKYLRNKIKLSFVDTSLTNGKRPDTAATAEDEAEQFVKKIKEGHYGNQKKFVVLVQSNQPFVERQTLVIQRAYNKKLVENGLTDISIVVEGIGFGKHQKNIPLFLSELGALISEKYIDAHQEGRITSSRDPKRLQYRTRAQGDVREPMPKV